MDRPFSEFDVVVVASSAGGIGVLKRIVSLLPEAFPAPVMVVHHLPASHPSMLPEILARGASLPVLQARSGERLRPGCVYLAPPGRHLEVSTNMCLVTDRAKVNFHRPAADILFQSAARRFGSRTLGVVLTGYLYDGAAGSAAIRSAGGVMIAQDPETCFASSMPLAAMKMGVDFVLSPPAISTALVSLVAVPGVAAMFGVGRYRQVA